MFFKKLVSYFLIFTLLANQNRMMIAFIFSGSALFFSRYTFADPPAASTTEKLDELKLRYNLNNPTRNHQSDTLSNEVKERIENPGASRDMTPAITNVLSSPTTTNIIDLSKYSGGPGKTFDEHKDLALNLSKSHGVPTGDVQSNAGGDTIQSLNLEYAKSGTRKFVRGADGKLTMVVIEGVPRTEDATANDLYSNEYNPAHPGYTFESGKQTMYGDEEAIFDEGKATHQTFKDPSTGNSSSARGYRAITDGATRAMNEPAPLSLLDQSFNHMNNAQDPTKWLTGCTTQTVPSNSTISSISSSEHFCQDTAQANLDFCEVERVIKVPIYANTPGLRSCGVGCYEFDLNIDVWKTSKCRSSPGDVAPATFTLNLNMSHGIAIKNVTLTGTADDHFLYRLNGQKLWESNGGSQSTSGNINAGSCNSSGSAHTINTNLTSRVQAITGPLPTEGLYVLNFQADLRWKRNGGIASKIRFEVEDTSGEGLETKFIQYPEGCYDALKIEDKLTRGLTGVYNWEELGIDPSLPMIKYECTSPPREPSCPSGQTAFGSAGQESCYSIPEPPLCPSGTYNNVTDRCEYPGTVTCPNVSGVACGTNEMGNPIYPLAPNVSLVGLLCTYTDGENCGNGWSYQTDADVACPNGGTLDGNLCVMPPVKTNMCDIDNGYSLKKIKIDGVEYERCEGPVTDYKPNEWSCETVDGEPQTYSPSYCTISHEDFRDEDGNPIPTIDANGFPINPPFLDEDGNPIVFRDVAKCSKPQTLPEAELPEIPQSFCTFDEYEVMEEGDKGFPEEILAAIPPFYTGDTGDKTWKVNLKKYRCDPSQGRIMCFPDQVTGEQVCYDWEDLKNLPDRCLKYKEDPKCSEVKRECTEGWLEPITGRCMADTVTYRCDTETVIEYESTIEKNTCESMIPCAGGNCEVGEKEQNQKFVQAMVAGSILDNVQGDSSCKDPTDPTTCRIFEGDYKYCSWETSGLGSDCCEEVKGVDILGYITFTRQMLKVNQMAYSGAFGEGLSGGYQKLAQPVTDGYKAIADWANSGIRTASESIFGNAEATSQGVSAVSDGISAALSAVQKEVYKFVYDMLPEELGKLIFNATTDVVSGEVLDIALNETLGNVISNVMAVYAVYSLAKLALTLLTACDEYEMDMGLKLAQRQCFKVGSTYCSKEYPVIGLVTPACMQRRQDYCCYSSILARIVMKEAYSQLSINPLPYGTKLGATSEEADASCLGLTQEQLGSLDFNAPSMQNALNEWIVLLLQSGQIPSESDEQSLTGGATSVDATCPEEKKPVLFCYIDPDTGDQKCEHSRDANGELMYDTITPECVKKLTPGQIWNASDRKKASERIAGPGGYIEGAEDRVIESKEKIKTIIDTLDCSIVPRPPVCSFQFKPTDN